MNSAYLSVLVALEEGNWLAARAALDTLNDGPKTTHPEIPSALSFGAPEWYAPVLQGRIDEANIRRTRRP